jgi:hypothetical protein
LRSVTLDTTHTLEPSSTGPTQRTFGRQPTGRFHTVTFVRDRNNWVHPRSDNASTNTFGGRTVSAVRDEQGNSVTFALTNQPVMGGGLVHVVNAVSPGTACCTQKLCKKVAAGNSNAATAAWRCSGVVLHGACVGACCHKGPM